MTSDWYLDSLALQPGVDLDIVNSPAFAELEARVVEYLKNSWCSEQKARLMLELVAIMKPAVSVEIGAFTGSTALPVLAGLQHLGRGLGFVVDAWSNEEATRGLPSDDVNAVWWSGLDMPAVRAQFDGMLTTWSLAPFCRVLDQPSRQAVSQMPTIDFLHLDGNFSEEGALLDSTLYLPKVRSGGFVLLSNALVTVSGTPAKMKALWPLFDGCDVLCELDQGNTLLFRKK